MSLRTSEHDMNPKDNIRAVYTMRYWYHIGTFCFVQTNGNSTRDWRGDHKAHIDPRFLPTYCSEET